MLEGGKVRARFGGEERGCINKYNCINEMTNTIV